LLASFDHDTSNDADYVRFDPAAPTGYESKKAPGKFGKAIAISGKIYADGRTRKPMGHILYNARSNVNLSRGTLEFWLKSTDEQSIWDDGSDHQLVHIGMTRSPAFAGRPHFELFLVKGGDGHLRLSAGPPRSRYHLPVPVEGIQEPEAGEGEIALPVAKMSQKEWHHVLMAWDVEDGGRLWLAVDGKGVTAAFSRPVKKGRIRPAYRLAIGSKAGGEIADDLKVTDSRMVTRIKGAKAASAAKIDEEQLLREMDAARRWLEMMLRLQVEGGWYNYYEARSFRPVGICWNAIKNSDAFSPGQIGSVFLRAYEIFGDERYLSAARRTGEFFQSVQHDDGHFDAYFYATPEGIKSHVLPYAAIEETKLHAPLWFLTHLYSVTGDERHIEAAQKVADFLLEVQNDNGSWPHDYDFKLKKPWGPHGYACLNDCAALWSAIDMVLMYQMTGESKYIDSFFRTADWVISAQLPPPTCGWAQQYDENNNPSWARGHEPPAFCSRESGHAAAILYMAYDMSGNDRYLESLRKYHGWAKTVKWWTTFHDIETGKPIAATGRKVYFHGTPEFERNKHLLGRSQTRLWQGDGGSDREIELGAREAGPCFRSSLVTLFGRARGLCLRTRFEEARPTRRKLAELYGTYYAATAQDWVANQRESGIWQTERWREGEEIFSTYEYGITNKLLTRILAGRIALGDIPSERFAMYDDLKDPGRIISWIDPPRDWYKVKRSDLPRR